MAERVDLFYNTYTHFGDRVLSEVRRETFGEDIGQNSWLTVDELDRFVSWLRLRTDDHLLEVASGSGGPALCVARKTGCRVTGVDSNANGVATATEMAATSGDRSTRFIVADATARLPFEDDSIDALMCLDSMVHFPDRPAVFREWRRLLKTGRRAVFTDPVVVTGPVTNDEIATRSSIGLFLFVPPGTNESFIEESGLRLVHREDVTDNAALISGRWHQARAKRRDDLLKVEGEERFEGLQKFFDAVHRLTSERRLSRFVYVVEK